MEANGFGLLGHTTLEDAGPTMGLAVRAGYVYVGHSGSGPVATSVVDVRDPSAPHVVGQLPRDPGTGSHKAIVVGDLFLQSCERKLVWEGPPFVEPVGGANAWTGGLKVYDLAADPEQPRLVGFFPTAGTGVHRMTCVALPYAYVTASDDGYTEQFLRIVDLSDPAHPVEVGRWWYPGMWLEGGERASFPKDRRYALHHALPHGDLLFCGWWDAGLVILDVADAAHPQLVANLNWGAATSGATHTALPLPGRDVVVVTDECIVPGRGDIPKQVRVLDVSDPYSPQVLSSLPLPGDEYFDHGGRYGPHNLAEHRPHTRVPHDRVYLTCFNAGLRVYDLVDPSEPLEIASFLPDPPPGQPAPQTDDVTVDLDGRVYLTDRAGGGLSILEPV